MVKIRRKSDSVSCVMPTGYSVKKLSENFYPKGGGTGLQMAGNPPPVFGHFLILGTPRMKSKTARGGVNYGG